MTTFCPKKMKRFALTDKLIAFVANNLAQKNPDMSEEEIFKIVYNSYILDDTAMMEAYQKA